MHLDQLFVLATVGLAAAASGVRAEAVHLVCYLVAPQGATKLVLVDIDEARESIKTTFTDTGNELEYVNNKKMI